MTPAEGISGGNFLHTANIAQYISSSETAERIKYYPTLTERAPNVEIDEVIAASTAEEDDTNPHFAFLRHMELKEFSLQLLSIHNPTLTPSPSPYTDITRLDVSNNELSTLPGLAALSSLQTLVLSRNWFNALPSNIGELHHLRVIDASRNFLKPKAESLRFEELRTLSRLEVLDVSLNQKCRTVEHRDCIKKSIQPTSTDADADNITEPSRKEVEVLVTVWQEMSNVSHNCIGASAATRNPDLLRSQLEPWGTVNLRRRLVRDFGEAPTHPKMVDRAGVMERLLSCYKKEGLLHFDNTNAVSCNNEEDLNLGVGKRKTISIDGVPVRKDLLDEILVELKDWRGNNKRGGSSNHRERPTIKAECYMILCAPPSLPEDNETTTSRREKRRRKKMEGNRHLWDLALQAMRETDPEFAERCTEIAVTFGFMGSPHIDRQNSSHFYGLSLGDFTEGTGCVAVEMSPRVVAHVNTKHRLGKVEGRYPHWVTSYDVEKEERFSLIYYDTLSPYQTPGLAVFSLP